MTTRPQPTDTIVARIATRVARFLPVTRGRLMDEETAKWRAQDAARETSKLLLELEEDMANLLTPIYSSVDHVTAHVDYMGKEPCLIAKVHFETLSYAMEMRRDLKAEDLHGYTREILKRSARNLAFRHAETALAPTIYAATTAQLSQSTQANRVTYI